MTQPSSTFHGVITHHTATGLEFKLPKQSGFDENKNLKELLFRLHLVHALTFVDTVQLDYITFSFFVTSDFLNQIKKQWQYYFILH